MELKRMFRSAVAIVLAASMLSSISAGAVASVVTTPEGVIEGERLTGEYAPEGNAVYFGANTVAVDEEKGTYHVKLYREGDLSGTASVTIRSFDVSAVYGEDYELPDADTVTGSTGTYLERSAQEQGEPETITGSATVVTDDPAGLADGTASVTLTDVSMGGAAVSDAEKSGLAGEKEAQTGEPTREVSEAAPVLNSPLTDAIMGEVVPQYLLGMDYSAEQVVTFAPGESEQLISFRILDDKQSEGTEGFSLMIVDAEGAEPYTNIAFSVTINDNEPVVHSALSFSKGTYRLEDGSVTVTVKREGAEYSIATAVLTATDKDGDVLTQGEVAFAPYVNEQEITLELAGEASLTLDGFKAAEPGKITEASVTMARVFFPVFGQQAPAVLAADGEKRFSINMAGRPYAVVYKDGDIVGKVMDESYKPALQVGDYFFPQDTGRKGMMTYGHDGDSANTTTEFKVNGTEIWVQLDWHSAWIWDEGSSYAMINLENSKIDADYYRKIIPDWSQANHGMGGHKSAFRVYYNRSASGGADAEIIKWKSEQKFGRETDVGRGIEVKDRTGRITYRASAIDSEGGLAPELEMKFYGAVALYKKYHVTTQNPEAKTFIAGNGTISVLPMQFTVKCGAQTLSDTEARDLYVTTNEDKSNIVFTIQSTKVNGEDGVFGVLTGYKITVSPGNKDNKVTLNYPQDLFAFLDKKAGQTVTGGADYSADAIRAEKHRISAHLDTIPMDKYFIEWIESAQKAVDNDSLGYYQELLVVPQVAYNDVKVRFVAPEGNQAGRGHFKNEAYALGTEGIFHAGDVLDLSGVSDDPSWRVVGYDVSVNGGQDFDHFTSTNTLFLKPNQEYIVRPTVAENNNCIEIEFADEAAAANLSISNILIPQSELPAELKGKNILNLNPTATDVMAKMRPKVGAGYSLDVLVTGTAPDGKVYRPVFHDNMLRKDFNGQRYYLNARSATSDNRITVGLETVDASSIKTYSVDGFAMVSLPSIRNDGLSKHNTPAAGYAVMAAAGQGTMKSGGQQVPCVLTTAFSVDPEKGSFSLSGIPGKAGDRISVLIDNGSSDAQTTEIVLGSDTACAAGMLEVHYPYSAPYVTSITYSYDNTDNLNDVDLRDNTVKSFDDTLNVTAVVNPNGRKVKEAVFVVTTSTGDSRSVKAAPTQEGGDVFVAHFPKMLDNLNDGDRISVYLVDEETYDIRLGSETKKENIAYPTVETGLVIIVENQLIIPKNFEAETVIKDVNMPLLGAAASAVKTGELSFSRINWDDKQNLGYTLMINGSVIFGSGTKAVSSAEKLALKDELMSRTKAYTDAKQKLVQAGDELASANKMVSDLWSENNIGVMSRDGVESYVKECQGKLDAAKNDLQAKNPKSAFSSNAVMTFEVVTCLALDFVYNKSQQEFQLCRFAITIGGSFNIMKTWYTAVGSVPCFLNLSGGVQTNFIFGGVLPAGKDAISQPEFNKHRGNIRTLIGESGFQFETDTVLRGKVQVGCGMCGILSARGFVSVAVMFQALYGGLAKKLEHNFGISTDIAGGIGFDLVLLSINFNIARFKVGAGTLKGAPKVSFLGDFIEKSDYSGSYGAAASGTEYRETVSVTPYGSGTADLSRFGQAASVSARPQEVSRTTLLDNAADRTRPQLLQLPDGGAILFFLGSAGRDEADDSCLYYVLRDRAGQWGSPVPVKDDGTYDTMPDAVLHNGKVYIAWMDASRSFTGEEDFREKLNSFDISAACYDIASGKFGDPITLVSNPYFCGYPSLCAVEDHLNCVYMNRDISGVASEAAMLDYQSTYSTMACVDFTAADFNMASGAARVPAEQYITIRNQEVSDPLVLDYSRDAFEVNGRHLIASLFTVDTDEDFTTVEDRNVYLSLYDIDDDTDYYPIQLTGGGVGAVNPQMTNLGDAGVYATWMDENGGFFMLDVGELAEALFADGVKLGDPDYPGWFVVTEPPADMDRDYFEKSIYAQIARSEFRIESVNLVKEGTLTVNEYQLATDGKDVYVFFVAPNPGYDSTGADLYGMRYRFARDGEDGMGVGGFTTPVAITHDDNVIDEFSLYLTKGREVEVVSNYFTQSLNEAGEIQYSPNKLINISFEPAGSVNIVPGSLQADTALVPGTRAQISFTVRNEGMFPAEGWEYSLKYGNSVIAEGVSDTRLYSGEEYTMNFGWDVPEGISGNSITATVTERNVKIAAPDEQTITLDGSAVLQTRFLSTAINDDGTLNIMATAENLGNGSAAAFDEVVYDNQDPSNPVELYRSSVSGLAAGEGVLLDTDIVLRAENFDDFGCLNLKFAVVRGGQELDSSCTTFSVGEPLLASFNAESLSLEAGKTASVSASAAPWGDVAGDVQYVSADPTVAEVNKDTGAVTAVAAGETVIYAVFPDALLAAELPVTVTGETPKPVPVPDDDHGGGGSVKPVTPPAPPAPVEPEGTFIDVPADAYYAEPIAWAVENGITNGTGEKTFSPDMTCTRAQMVTFLWRAAGSPVLADMTAEGPAYVNPFEDVSRDAYYYDAVKWAVLEGITKGTSETTFSPNDTVTRGQTVTFLWRAAGSPMLLNMTADGPAYTNPFTDVSTEDYYYDAVQWAAAKEITKGTSDTTFSPAAGCTRAQIVTFLYRAQ